MSPFLHPTPVRRLLGRLLVAAAAALLLGGAGGRATAAAQGPAAPAPSPQELRQLLDQTDGLLAQIAALRGLEAPSPLRKAIRPRDAIVRRFRELVRDRYPGDRLEAERKVLVAFALIPTDFSLEKFLGEMAGEQVAAYYDHLNGEIVLADWLPVAVQLPVLTHELVHALQDRALNLRTFLAPGPGASDSLQARHALLEGEATAVMMDLLLRPQGLDVTRLPDLLPLAEQLSGQTSPILGTAPKFLRDQLLFPYTAGTAFAVAFRRGNAWPKFTEVYRDPPRSTHQILHPERYLVRLEDPQMVLVPDLRGLLGPGWDVVAEDDAGEVGMRGILERFLPPAEAEATAAGWAGDRYRLYERAGEGRRALVFLTAWSTEEGARRFAAAYGALLPKKYAAAQAGAPGRWSLGGDALLVERRGNDVLVIEGVPGDRADSARQGAWRLRDASGPGGR